MEVPCELHHKMSWKGKKNKQPWRLELHHRKVIVLLSYLHLYPFNNSSGRAELERQWHSFESSASLVPLQSKVR